jgi:adenylate kinase
MIAPPGAGKGTQGALIAAHINIPHIATGDLLRDHVTRETELGRAVKRHLDRGELVPDEIVLDMVRPAFIEAAAAGVGYLLDGVPRTMKQTRATYQMRRELGMTATSRCICRPAIGSWCAGCSPVPHSSVAPTTPRR